LLHVIVFDSTRDLICMFLPALVLDSSKPANIMCKSDANIEDLHDLRKAPDIKCRLGDFSSGWDPYTARHLYTKGPSPGEQTGEYVEKGMRTYLMLYTLDLTLNLYPPIAGATHRRVCSSRILHRTKLGRVRQEQASVI
jgi:hypothetical protein